MITSGMEGSVAKNVPKTPMGMPRRVGGFCPLAISDSQQESGTRKQLTNVPTGLHGKLWDPG